MDDEARAPHDSEEMALDNPIGPGISPGGEKMENLRRIDRQVEVQREREEGAGALDEGAPDADAGVPEEPDREG